MSNQNQTPRFSRSKTKYHVHLNDGKIVETEATLEYDSELPGVAGLYFSADGYGCSKTQQVTSEITLYGMKGAVNAWFNEHGVQVTDIHPAIVDGFKTKVVDADDAESFGFAQFNNGKHLCVDIPTDWSTISCRLPDGEKVTFSFVPYTPGGSANCIDIYHHTSKHENESGSKLHDCILFSQGTDAYRASHDDEKPVTLMTLLINHRDLPVAGQADDVSKD